MKKLCVILALVCMVAMADGEQTVFSCKLNQSIADLSAAGWSVKNGMTSVDGALQIVASGGERNWATYNLPVKEGQVYGGSIKVKPMGVQLRNNSDRGATFFFGYVSKGGEWVPGGEFPRGPMGNGGWTTVTIGMTGAVPVGVTTIQIWICLEGQGTAQFKDLEVHSVPMSANWSVDASTNPPVFSFNSPSFLKSGRIENKLRITVSQNPAFPENETFAAMVNTKDTFTFPHALKAGKWYARGNWCARNVYPAMTLEFTIGAVNPKNLHLSIVPTFANGRYLARPELTFRCYPMMPESISASIDGKYPLVEKSRKGDIITFAPTQDIPRGAYDILIKANGYDHKVILVNKDPAHTYSFRDDHLMILDGKPYFPIGTYRDPSDDRKVFDGIKEANFNMTHSYAFENSKVTEADMQEYLGDCTRNGLMAFMGIPRKPLIADDGYALQRHCADMYDLKGLAAYYVADEPELWINQYSLKGGADAVKAACPGVPRIILVCSPSDTAPAIKFIANGLSEIFWYDPYPMPNQPITMVKEGLLTLRKATQGKQSMWCVIQAFDWRQYDVKKTNPFDVDPKAGQIRCMTHLALSADVQGIIYYWLPKDRYDMRLHSPIQWAETKACAHELQSLYPYLIGRNAPQDITLPKGVDYWCRKAADGSHALGLINTTDTPVEFTVKALRFNRKISLGPWGVEVLKEN